MRFLTVPFSVERRSVCCSHAFQLAVLMIGLGVVLDTPTATAGDCGDGSDQGYDRSYACGGGSVTYGNFSTTLGQFSHTGESDLHVSSATAIGAFSNAYENSVAIGSSAKAGDHTPIDPGTGHIAIGAGAEAGVGLNGLEYSTAMGFLSKANNSLATALGAGATANFYASTALGVSTATTRDYQVMIGNGDNTYTLAGVNSQASKAAQTGTTYIVTTDGNGNLATSTFNLATLENLPSRVTQTEQILASLQPTVNQHTIALGQHDTRIANVEGKNVEQDGRLGQVEGKNAEQDGRLGQVEGKNAEQDGRLGQVEGKNTEQDGRLDEVEGTNRVQNERLTGAEEKNDDQDSVLGQHGQMLGLQASQIVNLDSRVTGNTQQIAALDNRVTTLDNRVSEGFNRIDGRIDQAFEGAAMAMAMAGAGLPADKNYAVSINWGGFEGENAFAGTAQARLSENFIIHGGLGVGTSQGTVGGRAGVTMAW